MTDAGVPKTPSERDAETHVIDPHGFAALVIRVRDAVAPILDAGRLPLVVGGDCPVLLGCLAAARRPHRIGLLFVDGHEDAYAPADSSTGEAADMELAFALGIADASWSPELAAELPLVAPAEVRILGGRRTRFRRSITASPGASGGTSCPSSPSRRCWASPWVGTSRSTTRPGSGADPRAADHRLPRLGDRSGRRQLGWPECRRDGFVESSRACRSSLS